MLSVGSREDARKGLGLGAGHGRGGEMEENELEEGEACSIQDDDATIDPDIALSYIDEKIQDVLGHFQKDFEGGVSAENLGAKFGGYGSFLPAYQRSPSMLSHPRSPQRMSNHNTPTSPYNLPIEAAHQNSTVATSTSVPLKNNSVSKAPPSDGTKKKETCVTTPAFRECTPQHDLSSTTSKSIDPNILKVRIRVGSENVLPRPNAAIYSDMGLEYSPSLSLDDSPSTSEGFSPEPRHAPLESPMTIYQIMTCIPVHDGHVLSPLPDSLLHLMEKEKPCLRDSKFTIRKTGMETCDALLVDNLSSRNVKVSLGKKAKAAEKNAKPSERKSLDGKGGLNDVTGTQKKEIDIETPSSRELVSSAPSSKVPDERTERLLCAEAVKSCISREPNKLMSKVQDLSPDSAKDEPLGGIANLDGRSISNSGNGFQHLKGKPNSRAGSSEKALEEGKASKQKDASFDLHMECGVKPEKKCDGFKRDIDRSKASRDVIVESAECVEVKSSQESTLHEQTSEKLLQPKDQSPGSKEMSGSKIIGMPPVELLKGNSKAVSSVPSKEKKKSSHSKIDRTENKQHSLGLGKESSRILSQDCHRDAEGDAKSEQMRKKTDQMESTFRDKARDSRSEHENNASSLAEKTKERLDSKKVQNASPYEAFGKNPEMTLHMANGPTPDAPPAPPAHVLIEEHWVCCDRCQKWRLLPYGTNPQHLPSKWLCAMLNWLPGMNKCSISEEETTRALHALYQAPPLENHTANGSNTSSVTVFTDAQHVEQNRDPGLHPASSYEKKKHTPKDTSHVASHPHLSHSIKKNQQVPVKRKSLNDVNQVVPQSSIKSSFQHVSKSSELNVEKDNDRQKEKCKMVERYFDGGEFLKQNGKPSKSKNKRDLDQDGSRTSKKVKADGMLYADEDWHSEHDLSRRVASVNHDGLSSNTDRMSSMKHDDNVPSKNAKCSSHDSLSGSRKKLKPHMQVSSNGCCKEQFSTFDEENLDKESAAKKRKVKDWQEGHVPPETVSGNRLLVDGRVNVKEEVSESDSRKGKKSRVLKAEGRVSVANKVDEKIDKKGCHTEAWLSNSSEHALDRMEEDNKGITGNKQKGQHNGGVTSELNSDCLDSLKRDLPYVHPPTAATSSSSKVSGSRKSKSNFQEARGSPVESVSSSPLRTSNMDKLANKKKGVGNDEDKSYAVVHCDSLDACRPPMESGVRDPANKGMSDYQDREAAQTSFGKQKDGMMHLKACNNTHDDLPPLEFEENYLVAGAVSIPAVHNKYHDDFWANNHGFDEEKLKNHYHSSGSTQRKSGKSSSQAREKHKSSKSEVKGKVKISDSGRVREDICSAKNGNGSRYDVDMDSCPHSTYPEDAMDVYNRLEKRDEKKRESMGRQSSEGRRDNHLSFGTQGNLEANRLLSKQHRDSHSNDNEVGSISTKGGKPCFEHNPMTMMSQEDNKSSNHFLSDRTEKLVTTHGRGKSQPLSDSGVKLEPPIRDPRTIPVVTKGVKSGASSADPVSGQASKVKQTRMLDSQNGQHRNSLRHPTPNGLDAPSPVRRDSNLTVVLKEARELKHAANHLKSEGRDNESTGLYFQAALKFLQVAFLLETSSAESGKHGEASQSRAMYSDTAKLCEFCAHEYEKSKEMAAAALTYKCMEVAYMRVVFSKHSCASKDRHELHTALQMALTGESPSSSASDVDNLNNQSVVDKAASTKGASSPQVAGNHIITARNRPNFMRLLNFVNDVNCAMEASKKSHNAFTVFNASPEGLHNGPEIIASVRRALDLGFHDVEGLLRLVRLSMESIGS